jgi:hypothetical protein
VTIWATMRGMQSEQIGPLDYVSATLSSVMAGHSRSKNGVASLAYVPAIHVFLQRPNNVDARDKPGHDDVERTVASNSYGISYTTILSAIPRSAASLRIGLIASRSMMAATSGAPITGWVMWISWLVDRLCTRAATFTVWPK